MSKSKTISISHHVEVREGIFIGVAGEAKKRLDYLQEIKLCFGEFLSDNHVVIWKLLSPKLEGTEITNQLIKLLEGTEITNKLIGWNGNHQSVNQTMAS